MAKLFCQISRGQTKGVNCYLFVNKQYDYMYALYTWIIYMYLCMVWTRAVVFRLFPKTVNPPQKAVGYRLTFIQYLDIIF